MAVFDWTYDTSAFFIVLVATLSLMAIGVVFTVVALALRAANDRKKFRRRRLEKEWQPQLLAVINGEVDPEALQAAVSPDERFIFLDYLYRFGRQLRGQELEEIREIARPYLSSLVTDMERGTVEARARRIQIIGLLGFNEHEEEILEALDDPSPLVAMVAARTLMRREHAGYIEAVLQRIHRFENWSDEHIASLLAGLGVGAAPALRRVLDDSTRQSWIRRVAANALAELNDVASANIAISILQNELPAPEQADSRLISALLNLLERTGRGEHIPLLHAWATLPDPNIRVAAVRALARVGGAKEEGHLVRALDDPSQWVALYAARGLRDIDAKEVLRDLASSEHPRAELAQQVLAEGRTTA